MERMRKIAIGALLLFSVGSGATGLGQKKDDQKKPPPKDKTVVRVEDKKPQPTPRPQGDKRDDRRSRP